jgi:hypothetical protein
MRITPLIVEEIKRTIPDAIALDPLINITRMQRHLEEQFNRSFSFYYTRKLMHKVAMQSRMEADRTQIEQRNEFYPRELPHDARAPLGNHLQEARSKIAARCPLQRGCHRGRD